MVVNRLYPPRLHSGLPKLAFDELLRSDSAQSDEALGPVLRAARLHRQRAQLNEHHVARLHVVAASAAASPAVSVSGNRLIALQLMSWAIAWKDRSKRLICQTSQRKLPLFFKLGEIRRNPPKRAKTQVMRSRSVLDFLDENFAH